MQRARLVVFGIAVASGGIAAYLNSHGPSATAARASLPAGEPVRLQAELIKTPDASDITSSIPAAGTRPRPLDVPPDTGVTGSISPKNTETGPVNIVRFGVPSSR